MTLLERPSVRPRARARRATAGLVASLGLLSLAACGFDVQTNQPYTPAEGVNVNLGPAATPVQVRNLMILSKEAGSGFLSATVSTADRDSLSSVTGKAFKADGTVGAALTITLSDPVAFGNNTPVVLTNRPFIEVKSADLKAGLDAELTLVFSTAGSTTLRVPVVDAEQPAYESISPTPAPSA